MRILKSLFKTPRDLGMQRYTLAEIQELMKPSDTLPDGLPTLEFAAAVTQLIQSRKNQDEVAEQKTVPNAT